MAENERLGEQGLRVMATARKDFDPATFDPQADLLPLVEGLTLLALVGIVDPPRPQAKDAIAEAQGGRHPGTHDHRGPRRDRRGDRRPARHRGPRHHRRRVRRDERRRGLAEIDGIGVIARVTPEHKVRLVDILRRRATSWR